MRQERVGLALVRVGQDDQMLTEHADIPVGRRTHLGSNERIREAEGNGLTSK